MAENTSNDNFTTGPVAQANPDAHGQAALLLVESLIHGLIARSILNIKEAIEIVDVAAEVRGDTGTDLGETPVNLTKSLGLLTAIRASLVNDVPRD